MEERAYALLGTVAPILAYVFIGVSILLSPWFSWRENALSDLGHSFGSSVASVYNFGLILSGLLVILYATKVLSQYAKWTICSLTLWSFLLQMVATFDEVYGLIHTVVSGLFFVSLGFASIIYILERRSYLAMAAFLIGLFSWVIYWSEAYPIGVVVPEAISSLAVPSWVEFSSLRIFLGEEPMSVEKV